MGGDHRQPEFPAPSTCLTGHWVHGEGGKLCAVQGPLEASWAFCEVLQILTQCLPRPEPFTSTIPPKCHSSYLSHDDTKAQRERSHLPKMPFWQVTKLESESKQADSKASCPLHHRFLPSLHLKTNEMSKLQGICR
jgi:hypothetical protein